MIIRLIQLFIIGITLAGCTKAAIPSVQALSTTLVQMKTSSANPFTQNFNANKYAVFTGQCLNIITSLQISFNDSPWVNIPTTAGSPVNGTYPINGVSYPYTETITAPGFYDVDCSDGSFNFWIYEHQLDELLFMSSGLTPGNSNINKVSIRGVSGSYATEPTVFTSPFQKGPPTKISLQKSFPSFGSGVGQCVELIVSVRAADDKYTNYSADLLFSLNHSKNGVADSGLMLYPDFYDCGNGTTSAQISPATLKISAGMSTLRVYYMPVSASIYDTHVFTVIYGNSPIALDTSAAIASFTIKSSSSTYLEVTAPYKIIWSSCYPINVTVKAYSGPNPSTSNATININPANDLEVFANSTCSAPAPNFSYGGASASRNLYVRLKTTATGSIGLISFTDSLATIDPVSAEIQYDLSGDTTIKSVRVDGPNSIGFSGTSFFSVAQYNMYGTPLLVTGPTTIPLLLDDPLKGNFCIGGSCSSGITSTSIPAFEYSGKIEYQPLLGNLVTISPNVSGSGITNFGSSINIIGGITKLGFVSPPVSIANNTCTPVQVQTQNMAGSSVATKSALTFSITGALSPELFTNASCSIMLSGSPTIAVSTSGTTVYWKPLFSNGSSRTLQATSIVITAASAPVTITP